MELGREFVRDRVRKLLGDTSDGDDITGTLNDYPVTLAYSSEVVNPPETTIDIELPKHYGFELRAQRRERTERDSFTTRGFSGTADPAAAAHVLFDKPTCERLVEQRITDIRIELFDIKEYLPRGTIRLIERTSPEYQEQYRSTYKVSLTVRGWIEDPERAVAAIELAVDLASRVSDAVTRAAGAELATGPYRDAPGENANRATSDDHGGVRRIIASAYTLLSRALTGWWPG